VGSASLVVGHSGEMLIWWTEFSLKLPGWGLIPGITMPIISYWDGQPLR